MFWPLLDPNSDSSDLNLTLSRSLDKHSCFLGFKVSKKWTNLQIFEQQSFKKLFGYTNSAVCEVVYLYRPCTPHYSCKPTWNAFLTAFCRWPKLEFYPIMFLPVFVFHRKQFVPEQIHDLREWQFLLEVYLLQEPIPIYISLPQFGIRNSS